MPLTCGLHFRSDAGLSEVTGVSVARSRDSWYLSRHPVPLRDEGASGRSHKRGTSLGQGTGQPGNLGPWLSSQDRDFEPLQPGAPIFQMFSGEDVLYEGESTVYPILINEAAYYEKGIAFLLTEKLTLSMPALTVLAPTPTPGP